MQIALDNNDINLILSLICSKQTELIKNKKYDTKEYLKLEELKIKIKSI